VHPRDNDLVVGTHGRSIWIIDDITPLQQYTPEVARGDAFLFEVRPAVQWLTDTQMGVTMPQKQFTGNNPPTGTAISYYLPINLEGEVTLQISDTRGQPVRTISGPGARGINRVQWNMRADPEPLPPGASQSNRQRQGPQVDPGTYVVTMKVGGQELMRSIVIEPDIWMNQMR
jgi:hypothetical protein